MDGRRHSSAKPTSFVHVHVTSTSTTLTAAGTRTAHARADSDGGRGSAYAHASEPAAAAEADCEPAPHAGAGRARAQLHTQRRVSEAPAATARSFGAQSAALRAESESLRSGKYEELIFSILFTLVDRSNASHGKFQNRVLPAILSVIDCFQLGSLSDQRGWAPDVFRWMGQGPNVSLLVKSLVFGNSFLALFCAVTAGVIAVLVLTAWVWLSMRRRRFQPLPARALRVLAKLLVNTFFISCLDVLAASFTLGLNPTDAGYSPSPPELSTLPWLLYAIISSVVIAIFVPYAWLISLVLVDFSPVSPNIEASVHGRLRLFYVLCQTVLVFVTRFLSLQPLLVNGLLSALALANALLTIHFQPYYSPFMNGLRSALFGGVAFFALASLCLCLADSRADGVAPCAVLLLATAATAALFGFLSRLRYTRLQRSARASAQLSDEEAAARERGSLVEVWFGVASGFAVEAVAELRTRFVWDRLYAGAAPKSAAARAAAAAKAAAAAAEDDDEERRARDAEILYRRSLQRHPGSSFVQISYGTFLQYGQQHPLAAIAEMKSALAKRPAFDMRFLLSSRRLEWEQKNHSENLAGDPASKSSFINVLEFRNLYERAKTDHNQALSLIKAFWRNLAKQGRAARSSGGVIGSQLQNIEVAKRSAAGAYGELLEKYPTSKVLLRAYGSFLAGVENDTEKAQELLHRADEIEEQEAISQARLTGTTAGDAAGVARPDDREESGSVGSSQSSVTKRKRQSQAMQGQNLEVRAVNRLRVGVVLGLVSIAGLAVGVYGEMSSIFTSLLAGIFRQKQNIQQLRTIFTNLYWIRMMSLAEGEKNTAMYENAAYYFKRGIDIFDEATTGLYLKGWPASGVLPSTHPSVLREWTAPRAKMMVTSFGNTNGTVRVKSETFVPLWDLVQMWSTYSKDAFAMPRPSFLAPGVFSKQSVRFLFDNIGYGQAANGIESALIGLAGAYIEELSGMTDQAEATLIGLGVGQIALLLVIALGVMMPSIARVRSLKQGVADLVAHMNPSVIKQIAKHYGNIWAVDDDVRSQGSVASASASESSSGGGRGDPEEATDADVDVDAHVGAAGVGGAGLAPRAALGPGPLKSGSGSSGDLSKQRRVHVKINAKRRPPAAVDGSWPELEAPQRSRDAEELGAEVRLEREGGTEARYRVAKAPAPAGKAKRGRTEPQQPNVVTPAALFPPAEVESPPPAVEVEVDGDSATAWVLAGGELEPRASNSWLEELRSLTSASESMGGRAADAVPLEMDSRPPRAGGPFTAPGGRRPRVLSGACEPPEAGHRPPKAAEAPPAPSALASILRTDREPLGGAGGAPRDGDPERGARAAAADRPGFFARLFRRYGTISVELPPPAGEQTKKAGGGGGGAGSEADIFRRMTQQYIVAFVLLGVIAVVNLTVCYYLLEVNRTSYYEIHAAGMRRAYLRGSHMWTLELVVNDGQMLSKQALANRWLLPYNEVRRLHLALRFGDPSMHIGKSDGRYKPRDDLMYGDNACLRGVLAECVPGRSKTLSSISHGLHWAIVSFQQDLLNVAIALGIVESTDDTLVFRTTSPPSGRPLTPAENAIAPRFDISALFRELPSLEALFQNVLDVDRGSETATNLYVQEVTEKIGMVMAGEAGVLSAVILFVAGVFTFMFRPMLVRLADECSRKAQFIRMIPPGIASRMDTLRGSHSDED